jgi:2-oxoglutarate ferredoxin oxidoreductase subunit gamma
MESTRIVLSGFGGQGIITASIVLAEAAALYEGLNAVQTQVYGPEARGGATRADVIISQQPIHHPKVLHPHILVCLSQEAYNKFWSIIRPGGLLLVDKKFVKIDRKVEARQRELNMYEAVLSEIGNPIVLNICMIGALIGLTGLVKPESLRDLIKSKVPPEFISMNNKAFDIGLDLAEQFNNKKNNKLKKAG